MDCSRTWFDGYAAGLRNETDGFARLAAGPPAEQFIAGWAAGLRDRGRPVRVPNPFVVADEWPPPLGALCLSLTKWDVVDRLRRSDYRVRGVSALAPGLGLIAAGEEARFRVERVAAEGGVDVRYSPTGRGFFLFLEDDGPALPPEARS